MKKTTVISKMFAVTLFLSLLLINVGSLRCASKPNDAINLQSQAQRDSSELGKARDQNWLEGPEDKNVNFKVLEWMIKQKLLRQYEKMEIEEDLDANLD